MARIQGADPEQTKGYVGKVLQAQKKTWGSALLNHLVYARRPALFKAVRGMWSALNHDKTLDEEFVALLNRRVAPRTMSLMNKMASGMVSSSRGSGVGTERLTQERPAGPGIEEGDMPVVGQTSR